ncbi:MAG TPA: class I SAM-dependent methyltransferase [Chloroflexota bacterium]
MEEPQNVYDDPGFLAGYAGLDRFGVGWPEAMEQPALLALLPPVQGLRVVDLGCGAGQLAVHLANAGATAVLALDVSEQMLALARAERSHPRVTYRHQSIEDTDLPSEQTDLVVSTLAFHYVADYAGLVRRVARSLVPGGWLVFSTEHPIYTARLPDLGWALDADGQRHGWTIDHYADEGERTEHWFVEGVRKYHRTVSSLINGLLGAGLTLERIVEPTPSDEFLRHKPDAIDERRRPMFLLLRARRD